MTKRWQFSLRTLVTVMLCVACFFGGWKANDWRREMKVRPAGAQKAHADALSKLVVESAMSP